MTTDFAKGYMSGYYQGGALPCGDDDYALGVRRGVADKLAIRAASRPYQTPEQLVISGATKAEALSRLDEAAKSQ